MDNTSKAKRLGLIFSSLAIVGIVLSLYGRRPASAQGGWESSVRINVGTFTGTRLITLSNASNTQVFSASVKRPDETCFNNSPVTVWIGTNTASTNLLIQGFPILSSATVKFGGYTGGDVYAILNSGSGEFRCWDGQTN